MSETDHVASGLIERVVFDSSVLLGTERRRVAVLAQLGVFEAFLSHWITAELVRKRTEWIAERAVRDGVSPNELRQRLRSSRERVNAQVAELSRYFNPVDTRPFESRTFPRLMDPDDWPLMHIALAARADTLVTEHVSDLPLGGSRDGVLFLDAEQFPQRLYRERPGVEDEVNRLLGDT